MRTSVVGVIHGNNMLLRSVLITLTLAFGALAWSGTENPKWWQTGLIYQIYPKSYKDSDSDGFGDLKGIKSKVPYMKELGITALWLSPIYPSPQADSGYDISNFVDVDPLFGTLQDFDNLVDEAHKTGIKVVMDLVPNHSSDEHAWFVASSDPAHPDHQKYKNYYVWMDGKGGSNKTPPNNWLSVFRGPGWTFHPKRKQWYFHQFDKKQPDLNYRNPEVVEEMKNVIRFWMDRKVDGFRADAIPFMFEDSRFLDEPKSGDTEDPNDHSYLSHIYTQNQNETYDMIQQWRAVIDARSDKDRVFMGEVYASLEDTVRYYGTKERPGCHFPFNFLIVTGLSQKSNSTDFKKTIDTWMAAMNEDRWPNWVIGNHDQKRVTTRFGPELADALNMISLSLPGTGLTYNGEEIAMTDNFIRWEDSQDPQAINKGPDGYLAVSRDTCRTPMQWDDSMAAGFSSNYSTWLPVNPDYWQLNVKNQKSGHSHYNVYRRLLEARKTPTMQRGDVTVSDDRNILVIKRTLENHATFWVVVNLGTREIEWSHNTMDKMTIFTSSLNSGYKDGDVAEEIIILRPKSAFLLQGTGH